LRLGLTAEIVVRWTSIQRRYVAAYAHGANIAEGRAE